MNPALWISKTGLIAQDAKMGAVSNNLANVNTAGFKKDRVVFEDLFYQTHRAPGAVVNQGNMAPSGIQFGTGVKITATQKQFTNGDIQTTYQQLDVAIMGQGFFQVEDEDGAVAYTRAGNLQVNSDGTLVNAQGLVLVPEITFPAGTTQITISNNGTVSALAAGNTAPVELGQLTLVNFINPVGLEAIGNNLYKETVASGDPIEGVPGEGALGGLKQGALESSNVKVVEEMVDLITIQRAYEMNTKMVSAADNMLKFLTQTL